MGWFEWLSGQNNHTPVEDHRNSGSCTGVTHSFADPTTGVARCGDLFDPLPANYTTHGPVECLKCLCAMRETR